MAHLVSEQDRHNGKAIEKTTDKNGGSDSKEEKEDMEKNHLDLQQPVLHPYAVIFGAALNLRVKRGKHFKKGKEVLF